MAFIDVLHLSQQNSDHQHIPYRPQQKVTRPEARFKPTLPNKSEVLPHVCLLPAFDFISFNFRTWSNSPDMPTWTAFSGVAPSADRKQLFSVGGYHPKNSGPWPTEHIYSDMIASMDLETVIIFYALSILPKRINPNKVIVWLIKSQRLKCVSLRPDYVLRRP